MSFILGRAEARGAARTVGAIFAGRGAGMTALAYGGTDAMRGAPFAPLSNLANAVPIFGSVLSYLDYRQACK